VGERLRRRGQPGSAARPSAPARRSSTSSCPARLLTNGDCSRRRRRAGSSACRFSLRRGAAYMAVAGAIRSAARLRGRRGRALPAAPERARRFPTVVPRDPSRRHDTRRTASVRRRTVAAAARFAAAAVAGASWWWWARSGSSPPYPLAPSCCRTVAEPDLARRRSCSTTTCRGRRARARTELGGRRRAVIGPDRRTEPCGGIRRGHRGERRRSDHARRGVGRGDAGVRGDAAQRCCGRSAALRRQPRGRSIDRCGHRQQHGARHHSQ
jgi:hypothetical protein